MDVSFPWSKDGASFISLPLICLLPLRDGKPGPGGKGPSLLTGVAPESGAQSMLKCLLYRIEFYSP